MSSGQGTIFTVNIKVAVGIAVVTIVFILGITFAYWVTSDSIKDTIMLFAAASTGGGAVLAAFYAARTLELSASGQLDSSGNHRQQLEKALKDRAMMFGERWNSSGMRDIQKFAHEVISIHEQKNVAEFINQNFDQTKLYLNFLEEMALAVNSELIDSDIAKKQFHGIVNRTWHKLEDWIRGKRSEINRPQAWIEFENLAKIWGN